MGCLRIIYSVGLVIVMVSGGCGPGPQTLTFLQEIEGPVRGEVYALFGDSTGASDPAWFVFLFPKGTKPEGMAISSYCMNMPRWMDQCVLWNWSEDGSDMDGAHIELLKGRYLVLVRGGLYYGLYDTAQQTTLLNDPSPWNTWVDTTWQNMNEYAGRPFSEERAACHAWAKKNIHDKIVGMMSAEPGVTKPRQP